MGGRKRARRWLRRLARSDGTVAFVVDAVHVVQGEGLWVDEAVWREARMGR